MNYQQLTEGKRYQISVLLAQGYTLAAIAKTIDVHRSTVHRELSRNSRGKAYLPDQAQNLALKRRRSASKYRIPANTIEYFELALSLEWNPEQISGVGDLMCMLVSREWIYRYVATNKAQVIDISAL